MVIAGFCLLCIRKEFRFPLYHLFNIPDTDPLPRMASFILLALRKK